jgi:hypothetical protein
MSETHILTRLLRIYFPRISEFGSASEFRRYATEYQQRLTQWHSAPYLTKARKVGHTCNLTPYRNVVTLQVTDAIQSYNLNFHPVPHDVTVSCERYTMGFRVCYGSQKHHECKEEERSGRWWRVTLHVQTWSGRILIIPLMWRPNTDSAPNTAVMLPRNQLLIRYVVTSPVHTVTIRCYGTR